MLEASAKHDAWKMPSWAWAIIGSMFVSVGGYGLAVWNSSSLHEATLITHAKIIDQLVTQRGVDGERIARLETKVASMDQEQRHFQALLMDKVEILLEQDRFRQKR
jgi:hypothetical protein